MQPSPPQHSAGTHADVKKMEETPGTELRYSKDHLEVMLHGISDGITLQNPDGSLLYANTPAARIIGFDTVEELLATPVRGIMDRFDMLDENGMPLSLDQLPSRIALQGKAAERLLRFRVKQTGEERWSLLQSTPVHDSYGNVEYVVNIFQDLTERKRHEEMSLFLSNVSTILSSSLDYETTLASVAQMAVPKFADWCAVNVLDSTGIARSVAVAHVDPSKVQWAREVGNKYAAPPDSTTGMYNVIRTGKSELYTDISPDLVRSAARDEEHLMMLEKLGMRSVMIVPMMVHGKALGTISFISAESGRNYMEKDLEFAENLAARAALAVENSRLYMEAQLEIQERQRAERELRLLNEILEQKVEERTRELRLSQEQDKAMLHRLKNVIAQLPMGAIMLNEENCVIEANQMFCNLFHVSEKPSALVGRQYFDFLSILQAAVQKPDEYAEAFHETFRRRELVLNHEILLKDGRIFLRDYIPVYDDTLFLGQILLYRDVTRDKRIDAAKSEFMSLASHQLRTPLTTIRWALGRLQKADTDLAETHRHMLGAAKHATALMADTINAMLTISRIEAGQIEPKIAELDVTALVQDIVRESAQMSSQKKLTVTVESTGNTQLQSDYQLLKEVLANLVRNSIQYTKENGTVNVFIDREPETLKVRVADNGVGIPLHQQERIFQKFFRADNAILRQPDGTGLGLYLSYITVKLLGGSISFTSEESMGTTFIVTLPLSLPREPL